jgi:hypothetical protein
MKFVNLTAHAVRIHRNGTQIIEFPPSGVVARVSQAPSELVNELAGVPIGVPGAFGQVEGVPDEVEGVGYIVSGLLGARFENSGRRDIFVPATGPRDGAIRGKDGQITAVAMLNQIS